MSEEQEQQEELEQFTAYEAHAILESAVLENFVDREDRSLKPTMIIMTGVFLTSSVS